MTELKTKKCLNIRFGLTSFTYRIHIFYFPVVFLYAYRETSHRGFYHLKKLKVSAKILKIIVFSAKMIFIFVRLRKGRNNFVYPIPNPTW
jgi:hypothetical protein